MRKRFKENTINETKSAGELFKREISNTRRFVKAIISENRESSKERRIDHFHPKYKNI